MPRLEVVLDSRDISLEVSSPGISRTIKYFREFSIFQGRKIRLMEAGENDWIEGTIVSADEQKMVLRGAAGERSYTREEITKAKISEG
jgi:ribosome maturation factor RimP